MFTDQVVKLEISQRDTKIIAYKRILRFDTAPRMNLIEQNSNNIFVI